MAKTTKVRIRRIVASFLALTLLTPILGKFDVLAKEEVYSSQVAYDLQEMKQELATEVDQNKTTITFPREAVVADVGTELVYHLFRQGDRSKEQTVTLMTMDITAGYKQDYEVLVDQKVVKGTANKLMDGSGVVYEVYLGENVLKDAEETAQNEETAPSEEELLEQIKAQTSSTFDVTFAPEEEEKEIRIRMYTPDKALGNKEMQLGILEYPEDVEVGEYEKTAITLQDEREAEAAEIAIVDGSVKQVDGYVTALVERTGNTAGYTEYNLSASDETAVNGVDYELDPTKLVFTPGVSVQRIYIPVMGGNGTERKSFTLEAEGSVETVEFEPPVVGATFSSRRDLVDIPMSEFAVGEYSRDGKTSAGDIEFREDGSRYVLGFSTGFGDGDNRSASIRTDSTYDFTGIERIRISASYRLGTVMGDYLDVYASNEDFCTNKTARAQLEANKYGGRFGVTSLTGQNIRDVYVDRRGEYRVYLTAEQHSGPGYIGYNIYNQDYGKKDEGHVALVKKKYQIELVNPKQLNSLGNSKVPVTEQKFTLALDDNIAGTKISDVYRDDVFVYSYEQNIDDAELVGYEILDQDGQVLYSFSSRSTTFVLDSACIRYCETQSDGIIRVRPKFQLPTAKLKVLSQDFASIGATTLRAEMDEAHKTLHYYEEDTRIGTITWFSNTYNKGETLTFKYEENAAYDGDYHFDSYKLRSGASENLDNVNPVYYTDYQWSVTISDDFYEVTPILSNKNAPLYLEVSNATKGGFVGKPEGFAEDQYTVKDYDGKYGTNDIAIFRAEPNAGYRAKWTYYDVITNMKKTYYGPIFYYRVQSAVRADDNIVSLEFAPEEGAKEYTMAAQVYMQGGSIIHQPDADSQIYTPLEGANVSAEGGKTLVTDANGETGDTITFYASPGEVHTALVVANGREYVHEFTIPDGTQSIKEAIYLSYYYNGPHVTSIRYYDNQYTVQDGDTIYLDSEGDICEIAATVDPNGKKVNRVEYSVVSPDGEIRKEPEKAEIKGSEYTWAAPLGMFAEEGDQIWIELIYEEKDSNGNLKRTSYGKMNTGYNIVIADFQDVSYIPDTGGPSADIPVFGNIAFNFAIKGLKPVFTTSRSGNYFFINIGVSYNVAGAFGRDDKNKMTLTKKVPNWTGFEDQVKAGIKLRSKDPTVVKEGVQTLKKSTITFTVPVSLQIAYYMGRDDETDQMKTYFLGAYFNVGCSATYQYTLPIIVEGFPLFVALAVAGSVSDVIELYAVTNTGKEELVNIKDPTKSSYKPFNDFKADFNLTGTFGVGVNSLLDVSGGLKGGLTFDWIDFQYGNGKVSLQLVLRMDLLLIGKTFNINIADMEMFNTNPYTSTQEADVNAYASTQLMESSLNDYTFKQLHTYNQEISGTETAFVSDAYEFSRPVLHPIGEDKYLILCTVDSAHVYGAQAEDEAVLSYVIYDVHNGFFNPADGTYTRELSGKQIFISVEPEEYIGDSLNLNPKVTDVGEEGYMITWNSVLYDSQKDQGIHLGNTKMVMKTAIIQNPEDVSQKPIYKSLALEGEVGSYDSGRMIDIDYDKDTGEAVLLWRASDLSGMKVDSTLKDYLEVDRGLCVTSLSVKDAVADPSITWKDSIVVAASKEQTILKSADLEVMTDEAGNTVPILTWHEATGENALLCAEGEEGVQNDIIVADLSYNGSSYQVEKEVTVPSNKTFKASPVLASGDTYNVLMWNTNGYMAIADPVAFLQHAEELEAGNTENYDQKVAQFENITSVAVAGNDDFQLVEGKDGKLYSMWTEGSENGDGQVMKMACLEEYSITEEVDGKAVTKTHKKWGVGSVVAQTTGQNDIQHFSPMVDKDGVLHMVYRVMDLETGHTQICRTSKDLAGNLVVSNVQFDQHGVKPGQLVTVTATVKNEGVRAVSQKEITLHAEDTVEKTLQLDTPLASGEETTISYQYQVPETIRQRDIPLTVAGVGPQDESGLIGDSLYATAELFFEKIAFVPLHVTNDSEPDKYKVVLKVTNEGEVDSNETEAVASYLEYRDDDSGNATVYDHVLGQVTVPQVAAGDSEIVTFTIEVPQEYYVGPECKYAEVDFALYENYGTEDQVMVAMEYDGVKALTQERADEIKAEAEKYMVVSDKKTISVECNPVSAKQYTSFTYESSDPSIASVDENGIVTAHKEGTCTIRITTQHGISTTTTVHVTKEAVKPTPEDGDQTGGGDSGTGESSDGKKPSVVKTGDTAHTNMWMILLILSAATIVQICWRRRKSIR